MVEMQRARTAAFESSEWHSAAPLAGPTIAAINELADEEIDGVPAAATDDGGSLWLDEAVNFGQFWCPLRT